MSTEANNNNLNILIDSTFTNVNRLFVLMYGVVNNDRQSFSTFYLPNTRLVLKNCAPFTKCNLEINDEHVNTAENLDIVMLMYNLIEYSDN